ncbi:hypothetical protein BD413DRAFT_609892 [Trametes elegans]|nr:hypothetical protein BD413DRAFT_609892 [Trametes elegans]
MAGTLFLHSYYVVNIINAILYGIELVLYFCVLRNIYEKRQRTPSDKFLTVFSTVLVLLNTVFWTTQVYFGEMMWITHVDYPGGADAYWDDHGSVWYQIWGMAACVVCNLMNDALLVHRCVVIWSSRRIVLLPGILWFASLAFAVGVLYESGRPDGGDYFAGAAPAFVTAYTASTFAFNVAATALIVGRIVALGRRMAHADGRAAYTGAVAIVVESALPFTVFSAAYLVTYAIGSDVSMAFSFYAMFTCISPLLIILRVLSRRAWTKDSHTLFTTTISHNGTTDWGTTTSPSQEMVEKRSHSFDGTRGGGEVDITELPV